MGSCNHSSEASETGHKRLRRFVVTQTGKISGGLKYPRIKYPGDSIFYPPDKNVGG